MNLHDLPMIFTPHSDYWLRVFLIFFFNLHFQISTCAIFWRIVYGKRKCQKFILTLVIKR